MTKKDNQVLVSLIIRTKNEERWIASCLRAVFDQSYKNFEVIIVDNCSTDQTVRRAKNFPVKVVSITDFYPGKAINEGIRAASGTYLVCLSGHCIPTTTTWLEHLILNLSDINVAGVYGRQEPLSFTSDLDKRDLLTIFGLDKKTQIKDSFFHNANSAFRRDVWEKFPFNEEVTNVEDRIWGRQVIASGMKIIYEPDASVYHWHGVNHDLNPERARKIVRILESLEDSKPTNFNFEISNNLDIVAIIPIRGLSKKILDKHLLEYTISAAIQSKLIKRIIVSTDDPQTASQAEALGALAPFLRSADLSEDYVDTAQVLEYSLSQVESRFGVPDLVVLLEETYPFRPPNLIDNMIRHMVRNDLDAVIAAKPESRGIWLDTDGRFELLADGFMPSALKKSRAMLGLIGLISIMRPNFIREGRLYGERLGIYEVEDPFAALQIRDELGFALAREFMAPWWQKNYVKSHINCKNG